MNTKPPKPPKHALALLRRKLRMTQRDAAALFDCSVQAIQSIEVGRLRLSERMANKIVSATGVGRAWLLDGAPVEPIPDCTGNPYSRAAFERMRDASLDYDFGDPVEDLRALQMAMQADPEIGVAGSYNILHAAVRSLFFQHPMHAAAARR